MRNISNKQKVGRAKHDLRLGVPVVVSMPEKKYLVSAIETIDESVFSIYQGLSYEVMMPAIKARSLWDVDTSYEVRCRLRNPNLSLKEMKELILNNPNLPLSVDFTSSSSEDMLILKLVKAAELLPDVVLVEIKDVNVATWCAENGIIDVTVEDILECLGDVAVQKVCEAPLVLNGAENSTIIVYRSSGKDHYAIVIGDPLTKDEPMVRIHSSCYTGDLLDSLTCDCGSQLKTTIEFMAKNEGGIILYLLQEGRSIGLTNKVRAYYQQSCNNFDTVDANRILGFEDDERDFQVAAKILKSLSLLRVKLITNNKNKILQMQNNGIKVSSYIKSKIKYNKYNMHYLHTKFNKLNHIINY